MSDDLDKALEDVKIISRKIEILENNIQKIYSEIKNIKQSN